jgi:hypothetical protein
MAKKLFFFLERRKCIMKKGLFCALLIAGLVVSGAPVSAKAPIIDELGPVIIGSVEDIDNSGTVALHLLKYLNIYELTGASIVHGQNPAGDDSRVKIFYSQAVGSEHIKASNATALITPLTAGDIAAIDASGTIPGAGKQINAGGFNFLSLINVGAGTEPTEAYSADAATNGATADVWTAAGVVGDANPAVITVHGTDYASDGDENTTLRTQAALMVYSILDVADSFSPAETPVYNAGFDGQDDGWLFTFLDTGEPAFFATTGSNSGTALCVDATAAGTATHVQHSYWQSTSAISGETTGIIPADEATNDGSVYCMKATVSSVAATTAGTAGFRLLYLTALLDHVGGVSIAEPLSKPTTGNNVEARAYWEVPFHLAGWKDGEELSDALGETGNQVSDARAYHLQVDIIDNDAAFANAVCFEDVAVTRIPRPGSVTPVIEYGGAGTAFNDGTDGWASATNTTILPAGTATIGAANVTYSPGSDAGGGFIQVNMPIASGTPISANELMRTTANVGTSSVPSTPHQRFFRVSDSFGLLTGDVYGSPVNSPFAAPLPGSPDVAGSDYRFYAWTHTPAPGALFLALFDCYNIISPRGSFPAGDGTLTLSSLTIEKNI